MKKIIIFLVLIALSCSDEVIKKNESIVYCNVKILIKNNENLHHIYFKNNSNNEMSFSADINTNQTEIEIFPGNYSVYILSLTAKSETTKYVDKYFYLNTDIFENKNFEINLETLSPVFEIQSLQNQPMLIIHSEKISNIFSLSSISLKQGSDRARSLDFQFDPIDKKYYAPVMLYQNGDWFMNISYSVKALAQDERKLESDSIKISTTYFSNVYLGNYNFIQ